MIDDVVDPLDVVHDVRVYAVFVPPSATVSEAGDTLDAVNRFGVPFRRAHEASATVACAGVRTARGPTCAQHVVADQELLVRVSTRSRFYYW